MESWTPHHGLGHVYLSQDTLISLEFKRSSALLCEVLYKQKYGSGLREKLGSVTKTEPLAVSSSAYVGSSITAGYTMSLCVTYKSPPRPGTCFNEPILSPTSFRILNYLTPGNVWWGKDTVLLNLSILYSLNLLNPSYLLTIRHQLDKVFMQT